MRLKPRGEARENRSGARGEEKSRGQLAALQRAARGWTQAFHRHRVIKNGAAQEEAGGTEHARQIAGGDAARGMNERARAGPQSRDDERRQILDVALGAVDLRKPRLARLRSCRRTDRKDLQVAPRRGRGKSARAIGGGEDRCLNSVETGRQHRCAFGTKANRNQRLDQRLDAARGKRRGKAPCLFLRAGYEHPHAGLVAKSKNRGPASARSASPISCPSARARLVVVERERR